MKTLRKTFLLTMFMAILVISLRTAAAEPLYVYLGEARAENNILYLQVGNSLTDQQETISYKVTLGDEELNLVGMSSYNEMNLHTSYVYLVDISGSIKAADMETIREILCCLINGLEQGDNACIMLVGDDTYTDGVFQDQSSLLQSVETIESLHEDTNLYFAIDQALNLLTTSNQTLERKCLVILSDGKDYQVTGITQAEVDQKIQDTNIPICSVAVGKSAGEETAKVMGSFARSSPGGTHMVYGTNDLDAETVAADIKRVAEDIVVLQADISGYVSNGTENYLQVELSAEGVGTAVDGYNVKSVFISQGVLAPTETPQKTAEEYSQEDTSEEVQSGDPQPVEPTKGTMSIAGAIILAVSALVGVLIIVKYRSKKFRRTEKNAEQAETDLADKKAAASALSQDTQSSDRSPAEEARPTLRVTLTRVGIVEEETMEVEINGELIIGRKNDVADLAFSGDMRLSSGHCRLLYDGHTLLIEDMGSLNGTFVNGIPIREPYALKQDDKIYIGSMEWRIHW